MNNLTRLSSEAASVVRAIQLGGVAIDDLPLSNADPEAAPEASTTSLPETAIEYLKNQQSGWLHLVEDDRSEDGWSYSYETFSEKDCAVVQICCC